MKSQLMTAILLGLALAVPRVGHAQNAAQALQQRLLSPPSTVTLNLTDLRLSKLPHGELKVVEGVPRPGFLNIKLDSDEIAHRSDTLSVKHVEYLSETKNDFIRITLATQSGASAKLAFQLAKGAFASLDESALEQALAPVLTSNSVAPVPAAETAPANVPGHPHAPDPAHSIVQTSAASLERSSKKVDFPAAAPGLPPMHASTPAPDGCWYESYFSPRFDVEFVFPQCPSSSNIGPHLTVQDGSSGPSVADTPLFSVYSKQPSETLRAAVKRVVIDAMKDPSARVACKASDSIDGSGTKVVEVTAAGPYTKRRSYPLSKGGMACDGLLASEDGNYYFMEFPAESKSVFIMIPNDKGAISFPSETIHFGDVKNSPAEPKRSESIATTSRGSSRSTPVAHTTEEKIPPMKSIWLSQGRVPNKDLVDAAATVVSFTHGMMFDSSAGDAIMAITCETSRQGSPVLMLHAEIPTYQGMQQTLANKTGTVSIGSGKHDEQLTTQLSGHFLDVAAPLTQTDVEEMSSNEISGQRTFSLMYFGGAGRDIAAGDLPPANGALDAVLNACHVTTPPRTVAVPKRELSPQEIEHLEIAKLSLGMSVDEVKQALGSGYRFHPGTGGKYANLSFLLAADPSSNYGMTFFDNALRAFTYRKTFAPGTQPLVINLINGVTEKTWLPLAGSSVAASSWTSDASGVPVTIQTQNAYPNCEVVREDATGAPDPFRNTSTISLLDTGPRCGVTVKLHLSQADDKAMAKTMQLMVVDYRPIHALVSGVKGQEQQFKDDQRKKASQVRTPF